MKNKHHSDKGESDGQLRVLVVDDSERVRECVCEAVKADRRFAVIGSANNGRTAVRLAAELCPDVVLMDLQMPEMGGLEATRRIKAQPQAPTVLMVTLHDTPAWQAAAKGAGADGLVSKLGIAKTLLPVLCAVHRRREKSKQALADAGHGRQESGGVLTPRERQIVQLIAEGRSSKQVAARLQISVKTVDTHRSNFMRKLKLHSVGELVRYAIRSKLIDP